MCGIPAARRRGSRRRSTRPSRSPRRRPSRIPSPTPSARDQGDIVKKHRKIQFIWTLMPTGWSVGQWRWPRENTEQNFGFHGYCFGPLEVRYWLNLPPMPGEPEPKPLLYRLEWAMVHVAYWIVVHITDPIERRLPSSRLREPKQRWGI